MAIIAGTYDFTVQRRADHTESIRITDSNDNAVNLTGTTIAAQVWDKARTGKYADFTVAKIFMCKSYTFSIAFKTLFNYVMMLVQVFCKSKCNTAYTHYWSNFCYLLNCICMSL